MSDAAPGPPAHPSAGPPAEAAPSLAALALAFNAVAFRSVGGGLAAWTQRMIVEDKRWLDEDEYLSASAICGILPGANQVNMAVFVGTRYRGFCGALAAVAGLVVLPACAAVAAGLLYLRFRDAPALRHALAGMSCAAVGLTAAVAVRQARHVVTALPPGLLVAATFAASALLRLPLLVTLAVLGPLGFRWAWRARAVHPPGIGVKAELAKAGLGKADLGKADLGKADLGKADLGKAGL